MKKLTFLLALLTCAPGLPGQAVVPANELLFSNLGFIDDIAVDAEGTLYVSFPTQGHVARHDPVSGAWVPVVNGFIQGMTLEPDGTALWVAEFDTGLVRRIDLATGAATHTLGGFGHPLEIEWWGADRLVVGTLATPAYATGAGTLHELTIDETTGALSTQQIAAGIVGGMDVVAAAGNLYVTSLGSTTVDLVDVATGTITPVGGPVFQPADMLPGPGETFYVSTLLLGEVLQVDPEAAPVSISQVAGAVGSNLGNCEDLAEDPEGRLLVSVNDGEIRRLDVGRRLYPRGTPLSGLWLTLEIDSAEHAGWDVQFVASLGLGYHPVPNSSQVFPLAADPLLAASVAGQGPFVGFSGQLDGAGTTYAYFRVPPLPPATQQDVHLGAVIFDTTASPTTVFLPDFFVVRAFTL